MADLEAFQIAIKDPGLRLRHGRPGAEVLSQPFGGIPLLIPELKLPGRSGPPPFRLLPARFIFHNSRAGCGECTMPQPTNRHATARPMSAAGIPVVGLRPNSVNLRLQALDTLLDKFDSPGKNTPPASRNFVRWPYRR